MCNGKNAELHRSAIIGSHHMQINEENDQQVNQVEQNNQQMNSSVDHPNIDKELDVEGIEFGELKNEDKFDLNLSRIEEKEENGFDANKIDDLQDIHLYKLINQNKTKNNVAAQREKLILRVTMKQGEIANKSAKKDVEYFTDLIEDFLSKESPLTSKDITQQIKLVVDSYSEIEEGLIKIINEDPYNTEEERAILKKILESTDSLKKMSASLGDQTDIKTLSEMSYEVEGIEAKGRDTDEGLKPERLKMVEQVDKVIMRKFLESSNRKEFREVNGFMQQPPRFRLLAYSLIENNNMKAPNVSDAVYAQHKYVPNADVIIGKLERYAISKIFRSSTIDVKLLVKAGKYARGLNAENEFATNMDIIANFFENTDTVQERVINNYMELSAEVSKDILALKEIDYEDNRKKKIDEIKLKIAELKDNFGIIAAEFNAVKKQSAPGDDKIDTGSLQPLADAISESGFWGNALKQGMSVANVIRENEGLKEAIDTIGFPLSFLPAILAFPAIYGYIKNFDKMTTYNKVGKGIDILVNNVGNSTNFVIGAVSKNPTLLNVGFGLGMTANFVNIGLGMYQIAGTNNKLLHAVDARNEFKHSTKDEREQKYQNNMLRLQYRINSRQTDEGILRMINSSLWIGCWAIGDIGFAPGAVVAGAVAFSFGAISSGISKYRKKRNYEASIDEFFGLNKYVEENIAPVRKINGKDWNEDKRKRLLPKLREEMLLARGFKSAKQAYAYIARIYAKYIYAGITEKDNVADKNGYMSFVKSLGLKFDKGIPTEEMIFNKLMA